MSCGVVECCGGGNGRIGSGCGAFVLRCRMFEAYSFDVARDVRPVGAELAIDGDAAINSAG